MSGIIHGDNLAVTHAQYGEPESGWLDLSTGINPHDYPIPSVPPDAWLHLPGDDSLEAQAAAHYGVIDACGVLPIAGSQTMIHTLPSLLPRGRTGTAQIDYSEYAPIFARADHDVVSLFEAAFLGDVPNDVQRLVVANPNNPTARLLPAETLRNWHRRLYARGGTLIVDEAFIEVFNDGLTLAPLAGVPGLVVLRSIGKFYGLTGAHIGFAPAAPELVSALREALGHWTVNGPARAVVRTMLANTAWQVSTRAQLQPAGARLSALLDRHGLSNAATPLSVWASVPRAQALHASLAHLGIWIRLFDAPISGLRFGLPPDEPGWQRLADALASLSYSA